MRISLLIFLSMLVGWTVRAQDTLRVGDGARGVATTVSIHLTHAQAAAGLQFRLVDAPDALTITAVRAAGRAAGVFDVVDFAEQSDGSVVVVAVASDASAPLPAGSGPVLEVDVDAAAASGPVALAATSRILVDAEASVVSTAAVAGTFFDPSVTVFEERGKAAGFEQVFDYPGAGAQSGAWADYDGDGDLDLAYTGSLPLLFRNEGDGTFVEVAGDAGVRAAVDGKEGYNSGSASVWGDYDNDGDPDLFTVAGFGGRALLRNEGDGTFADATASAGLALDSDGAFSALWGDVDNDGWLDLYTSDGLLFRNRGDGTFEDISAASGIGASGHEWADYDDDGDLDLATHGGLYRNDGGTFTDVRATYGLELDAPYGGGSAWGDYDGDGDLDLYVMRMHLGTATLYRNDGDAFTDVSAVAGVDVTEVRDAAWADVENDGDLDLLLTRPEFVSEPYMLLRNDGDGTFTDITAATGIDIGSWSPAYVGGQPAAGAAWADVDADGRVDLFVANQSAPDYLFSNRGNGAGNHYLTVRLVGVESNRSAIGARIWVEAGGRRILRDVGGGRHASQDSPWPTFGLGSATTVDRLVIRWPSGLVEASTGPVTADRIVTVAEGTLQATGVHRPDPPELPSRLRLTDVYPNPFGDRLTVTYELPDAAEISLRVYDVLGREVATLVEGVLPAGRHTVDWSGIAASGSGTVNGLYVIRLTWEGGTQSTPVVRIR